MKILITGANGNLGKHLVLNAKNHDVATLCRDDWDTLDEKMSEVNIVIHAAGDIKSSINVSPANIIDSNISSTMRLLESSLKYKIKHFYFVSSCAVYGDVNHTKENQEIHSTSLNGDIKKLNEKIISSFCKFNNIDFTCFRVFNTFGGDDQFSIVSRLLKAGKEKGTFTLNNEGLSQRDFIHINDIAKIILNTLKLSEKPEFLNVGTGFTNKIVDLYNIVIKKYPDITTKYTHHEEVEYSRSDNSLLLKLIPCEFVSVIEYLNTKLN